MSPQLHLEPLPVGDIRRLVQARLGVEALPEALARQVAEKAEGNPLFAEEIVSFLTERALLHAQGGKLEFDPGAVAAALPASVQSLLTARVDRLAPKDRALLQAASVIGRRFDPELLAVDRPRLTSINRLARCRRSIWSISRASRPTMSLSMRWCGTRSIESLLTERAPGAASKIAEEIERRSGNRLAEVAEVLAHHYSQTDRVDKAFAYLSMAGAKSLGVYSLDEAQIHLSAATTLLDHSPDCATDNEVADFLVNYLLLLNLVHHIPELITAVERYRPRILIGLLLATVKLQRDVAASFPERLRALVDSLGFGYSNIRKHSVVQFQQCFELSPSLAAPNSKCNPIRQEKHSRAT